jgi:hypothetical protein
MTNALEVCGQPNNKYFQKPCGLVWLTAGEIHAARNIFLSTGSLKYWRLKLGGPISEGGRGLRKMGPT